MPGLEPGIHVFLRGRKWWMAGSSPAMTIEYGMAIEKVMDSFNSSRAAK
jgi:hypothetical protein